MFGNGNKAKWMNGRTLQAVRKNQQRPFLLKYHRLAGSRVKYISALFCFIFIFLSGGRDGGAIF